MVLSNVLKLCALDMFNTEKYIGKWFDFRETPPFDVETAADGEEKSKWPEAGYETSNFIELLGPIFFVIIFFVAIYLVRLILRALFSCCGDNKLTRKIRKKVNVRIFTLRFLLESCIEIGLCSMITVLMIDEDNFGFYVWESIGTVLAFLSLLLLFIAPIIYMRVTKKYLDNF